MGSTPGWGITQDIIQAATPTKVGTCKWCGSHVYSDEPRVSHGYGLALVWHLSCAETCRDLLTKSLGPADK